MNDIFDNKYKALIIEDWLNVLFIISSVIDLDANYKLKNEYNNNNNIIPSNDLRNEYIIADYINLFVFYVYTLRNYNNLKKLDKEDIEYQYAYNRYLGSLLIVIGFILEIDYYYKTTTFSK